MININRSLALETLQNLVEQSSFNYLNNLPDSFAKKQQYAFELFKQKIFLEEVIEESVKFNRDLNWESSNKSLHLARSAEELIEVYKLRSDVYTRIGYAKEFPDIIEGLNFDLFDKKSAILYCDNSNIITGTLKVAFDLNKKLPSEEKVSFDKFRISNENIVELSRFMIKHQTKGLNLEFKYLFFGVYNLYYQNKIDYILSAIKKDHYKLYTKFGGVKVEYDMNDYGNLGNPSYIVSWNPNKISPFFKRAFLNIKDKK